MTEKDYKRHIELYSDDVFRYLVKNLQSINDAEDILQDTFVALWQDRTKIENHKVKNWLFITAHNRMLKRIRYNKVREYDTQSSLTENERTLIEDKQMETKQYLDFLLSQLSALQKQCLMLKEWNGFSVKEIAQITNISEQNVKINIFRAKTKLRKTVTEISNG